MYLYVCCKYVIYTLQIENTCAYMLYNCTIYIYGYIYMHLSSESARIPNSARELNFSSFCDLTNLSYKLAMCRNLRHKGRSRIYTHVYVCIYIYIHVYTHIHVCRSVYDLYFGKIHSFNEGVNTQNRGHAPKKGCHLVSSCVPQETHT